jgi:geranylgeranyl diphosphate synthase type II
MNAMTRIEQALTEALAAADTAACPPSLAAAVRHAVFPGGGRIRPRLCLAVASACGETDPSAADGAAAAIELLHCASLVHDDMPCFDDAAARRGKPSVHRAFGEPLALLAGDALIVLAFQTLARNAAAEPARLARLLSTIAGSVGMPYGIVAGQAWECEKRVELALYHRAKTGALFAAATVSGALAAGGDPVDWRPLGEKLGEAYQVADDIRDLAGTSEELGKPVGRDLALGRPSAALQLGLGGALKRLGNLVGEAIDAIPPCRGAGDLQALIMLEVDRLLPKDLSRRAA